MKIFTYILIAIAVFLIIFNISKLDFQNISKGESMVALIGIVASICAVLIILIFKTSRKIDEKTKNQ